MGQIRKPEGPNSKCCRVWKVMLRLTGLAAISTTMFLNGKQPCEGCLVDLTFSPKRRDSRDRETLQATIQYWRCDSPTKHRSRESRANIYPGSERTIEVVLFRSEWFLSIRNWIQNGCRRLCRWDESKERLLSWGSITSSEIFRSKACWDFGASGDQAPSLSMSIWQRLKSTDKKKTPWISNFNWWRLRLPSTGINCACWLHHGLCVRSKPRYFEGQ